MIRLKELLLDQRFQYWPTSSIALHALRENILPLSLNTWYKYVNKLGMKRLQPAHRRKKSVKGIRAERPHDIWHADITVFTTIDNLKHYVYLVADNYSRKILSWRIADVVKRDIRKATIEEAVKELKPSSNPITLITDGGPENTFTDLLSTLDQPIEHNIALTDIHFSNSLIEAHNKTIKYNYLYRMNIASGDELIKIFPTIVDDFNNRPHVSLHGLTPNEACNNLTIDKVKLKLHTQRATEERKLYNQNNRCQQCRS